MNNQTNTLYYVNMLSSCMFIWKWNHPGPPSGINKYEQSLEAFRNMVTAEASVWVSEAVSVSVRCVDLENDEQICWWFVEDLRVQWYVKTTRLHKAFTRLKRIWTWHLFQCTLPNGLLCLRPYTALYRSIQWYFTKQMSKNRKQNILAKHHWKTPNANLLKKFHWIRFFRPKINYLQINLVQRLKESQYISHSHCSLNRCERLAPDIRHSTWH